jgi:hypothetical protein
VVSILEGNKNIHHRGTANREKIDAAAWIFQLWLLRGSVVKKPFFRRRRRQFRRELRITNEIRH